MGLYARFSILEETSNFENIEGKLSLDPKLNLVIILNQMFPDYDINDIIKRSDKDTTYFSYKWDELKSLDDKQISEIVSCGGYLTDEGLAIDH